MEDGPLPDSRVLERPVGSVASRVGLSSFDARAAIAFLRGDPDEVAGVVEDARRLAEALAGPDGGPTRVRLLARAVASARAQQRALEALLGDRLAVRDAEGVELVSRVLDGVAKRLGMFLKQLAAERALHQRPQVIVAHADAVHIGSRS